MSQVGQPKYKIVFTPGGSTAKRGRGRPTARNNDLEQAVKSITYVNSNASPTVKEVHKGNVNFSNVIADKPDKFLFLPKYVQKKVTVLRDTPKNSDPIKSINLPGSSGQQVMKKKKVLGDMALGSWSGTPKQRKKVVEEVETESPTLLCRVCGSLIEGEVISLVDENGVVSSCGSKLAHIVGARMDDNPLHPTSCCKVCSFKISVCFPLMVELKSSNEVMRETYADLQEGDLINPSAHIYTCNQCNQEVVSMREYISHVESHMQANILGELDKKLTLKEEPEEDVAERAQLFLDEDVDDGTVLYQNEAGELICEKCGRTFKYRFLLQLHRKAPKRGHGRDPSPPAKVCFVCKHSRVSTQACKLGDSTIPLCQPCRANVSFMVV